LADTVSASSRRQRGRNTKAATASKRASDVAAEGASKGRDCGFPNMSARMHCVAALQKDWI